MRHTVERLYTQPLCHELRHNLRQGTSELGLKLQSGEESDGTENRSSKDRPSFQQSAGKASRKSKVWGLKLVERNEPPKASRNKSSLH
jgi:hypothetical protein